MTAEEFIEKAKYVASFKTLYVMGGYGAPLTASNKNRMILANDYNRRPKRTAMIVNASADTFGFDCSGLIKGILWGWRADYGHKNGGSEYGSTIPDINADEMIRRSQSSEDFNTIEPGEILWTNGHIGIYIGNAKAVECTPSFNNCVQITTVRNMTSKGSNLRRWKKHGKFKYIDYKTQPVQKTTTEIAKEVIAGKWGNMPDRKKKLESAGYNYNSIRTIVNRLLKGE